MIRTLISLLFVLPLVATAADFDLNYLETLEPKEGSVYIPPSEVHDAYRVVVYVNVSENTPGGQRMWVLERDTAEQPWRLGLWDEPFWSTEAVEPGDALEPAQEPPFSWIISSGRRYADTVKSGPTPIGFYNLDDRSWRHSKGWVRHDIIDIMYIDLHYSSGRASGVAFHGTPVSEYKNLGKAESHGCVRMNQPNARAFYDYIHRYDGLAKSKNPLWGKLPRYYRSVRKNGVRQSYRRDGQVLRDGNGKTLTKSGYLVGLMFFSDSNDGRWPEQLARKPAVKPDLTVATADNPELQIPKPVKN